MSAVVATGSKDSLVIGGMPTVDLLPQEVRAQRASRALRRWLVIGVVIVAGVVTLGMIAAVAGNVSAQLSYAAAQQRTVELTKQEAAYADVFAVKQLISTGQEAQHVIGASEVDWQGVMASVVANMPADTQVQGTVIEQGSPTTQFVQAPAPLQYPRVATVTFNAVNPSFVPSADIVDGMSRVAGYVDASATKVESKEGYVTTVVLHLGTDALTKRFAPKEGE